MEPVRRLSKTESVGSLIRKLRKPYQFEAKRCVRGMSGYGMGRGSGVLVTSGSAVRWNRIANRVRFQHSRGNRGPLPNLERTKSGREWMSANDPNVWTGCVSQ